MRFVCIAKCSWMQAMHTLHPRSTKYKHVIQINIYTYLFVHLPLWLNPHNSSQLFVALFVSPLFTDYPSLLHVITASSRSYLTLAVAMVPLIFLCKHPLYCNHSFTVAFETVAAAVAFCTDIQYLLLDYSWPVECLKLGFKEHVNLHGDTVVAVSR